LPGKLWPRIKFDCFLSSSRSIEADINSRLLDLEDRLGV